MMIRKEMVSLINHGDGEFDSFLPFLSFLSFLIFLYMR